MAKRDINEINGIINMMFIFIFDIKPMLTFKSKRVNAKIAATCSQSVVI